MALSKIFLVNYRHTFIKGTGIQIQINNGSSDNISND
jgi:hypothetical protein